MSRPWIRLYADIRHNPKLQRLPDHLFKFVINCWSATADNGDELPPIEDLAWDLKIDPTLCESYVEHLILKKVFDRIGDKVIPHNWLDRQFLSDVSTDRVRKFRERHMKPAMKRRGNVSETAQDSDSDQTQIRSDARAKQVSSPPSESTAPAPDGIPFEEAFRNGVKIGGYTMGDDIAAKLTKIAQDLRAEPSQAAVCFLELYHRAHNTAGIKDGEAYLIGGFKRELFKLLNGASPGLRKVAAMAPRTR